MTRPHPSLTVVRRGLAFDADADALLRRVRDQLAAQAGRASYAAAVRYGLRLAAAHLGIDAEEPVALSPSARARVGCPRFVRRGGNDSPAPTG
jgi:hypothetical protein